MDTTEFLVFRPAQIRHQIREIITSYSHSWDLLAETCQNAVDAVKARNPTKGHINISIDRHTKTIEVSDNGTGIPPAEIPRLLSPFSSLKTSDASSVGEKGVGLTFVLFSSSRFALETRHETGSGDVEVLGAHDWLEQETEEMPSLKLVKGTRNDLGTTVRLRLPDEHPLFNTTMAEIDFLLRTKTAIGDTAHVFGLPPFNCDYTLTLKASDGKLEQRENECLYLLPTDLLSSSNVADIDEFIDWRNEADRSDAQKRSYWRDKAATASGQKTTEGRLIRYWYFYAPRRSWWEEINQKAGLVVPDDDTADEPSDIGYSGGMEVSTKFTPTGVRHELRPRGSAGYIPNFFILVDDPKLRLDIGRKSVAQPPISTLASLGYDGFRRIIRDVQKYTSGAPEVQTNFDKQVIFGEIETYADLSSDKTTFKKKPAGQEAAVAALFYECIGNGTLTDYILLSSGYKGKYDLYAKKKVGQAAHVPVVIEFKHDLTGLLRNFSEENKLYAEVDVAVVWEITEADERLANKRSLDIVENIQPIGQHPRFPEARKKLSFSVGIVQDIYIIEMRHVLGV